MDYDETRTDKNSRTTDRSYIFTRRSSAGSSRVGPLAASTISSSSGSSTSVNGYNSGAGKDSDGGRSGGDDSSTSTTSTSTGVTRLRRLKDLMWVREAREDLTAAEFACSVESGAVGGDASSVASSASSSTSRRATSSNPTLTTTKRRRAVDYEKLMSRLNQRIRDMGCERPAAPEGDGASAQANLSDVSCVLQTGVGMGSIVYTDKQREALLERILRTRQLLLEVMKGHELFQDDELPFTIALPELRVEIPKEKDDPSAPGPKLYVRDDGTVDWDGALQDREALRKFGTAVWARINGRDPESIDDDGSDDMGRSAAASAVSASSSNGHGSGSRSDPKVVTARIEETPEIQEARAELNELTARLASMEKDHVALLSSAISAGQAVANVNLASLQPAQRMKITESANALEKMKEQVSFQTMIYELERIYSYLVKEVGNPALTGYIPLQDRLNVAEFGLLESQIESFNRLLEEGDLVDADVLAVVMDQLIDFKRRLGIDYSVTGVTFDADGIRRWFADLSEQAKKGLAFYVKGVQLFWNDIVFCLSLVNRALQGYTLKPREVRTLRYVYAPLVHSHADWSSRFLTLLSLTPHRICSGEPSRTSSPLFPSLSF